MTDYFAEVMHRLRQTSYLPTVTKYVSLPGWSQRNSRAVSRMIAGLLKLLHPNAPVDGVDPSTMSVLVNTAIGLRSSVVDYLTMLDPTSFGGTKYEYSITGVERPKTKTKVRTKVATNQPSTVL
jgi:predicted ATP-dependent Lon-type protease